ncbi:MAG: DedA family protein [Burkholderiales bacterium]|nr:DedA family protein [Burkholderiales bacterium]
MFEFSPDAGLWGLAAAAFLSATVLPGNSEIVLVGVLSKFPTLFWQCIVVSTVANTPGGMTSYGIGRFLPAKPEKNKALIWLQRYGAWALLLSWVPLIGDALCVAAGWVRVNPWLAMLMMALGKFVRYIAVAVGWAWLAATWFA